MSELIVQEDLSLVNVTAFERVARNLSARVDGLAPEQAFEVLDAEIGNGMRLAHGSMLYTIYAICLAADQWEQLDVSQREPIARTFYDYVSRKFGVSQNSSTVDNYVNTARTWLVDEPRVRAPERVFIYDIVDDEAVPVEDEDGISYEVPVSVWEVSYSKLLASNARAAGDHMEEDDWGLLFNENVSQGELIRHYHGPAAPPDDKPSPETVRFTKVAGMVCVTDGQDTVEIAELDLAMIKQNNLAFRGWQAMRRMLDIHEEEDF